MTEIRLNQRNIGRLLTGQVGGIQNDLRARGRRVLSAAGPGFEMQERVGATRFRVTVRSTKTLPPRKLDALRRAFGAAR